VPEPMGLPPISSPILRLWRDIDQTNGVHIKHGGCILDSCRALGGSPLMAKIVDARSRTAEHSDCHAEHVGGRGGEMENGFNHR